MSDLGSDAESARLLHTLPGLMEHGALGLRVAAHLADVAAYDARDLSEDRFLPLAMPADWRPDPATGAYGDDLWQRFAFSLFIADWACYAKAADRADLRRMLEVVAAFPQGFRLWGTLRGGTPQGESFVPLGYTGWYPISKTVFDVLHDKPSAIRHRREIAPLNHLEAHPYLYVFNYSVVPALYGTPMAKKLMATLSADLKAVSPAGMAAVTVSPQGAKAAARFGLSYTGDITFTHDGDIEIERVYAARRR